MTVYVYVYKIQSVFQWSSLYTWTVVVVAYVNAVAVFILSE